MDKFGKSFEHFLEDFLNKEFAGYELTYTLNINSDDYIDLNLLPVLEGKGKISSDDAQKIAKNEYDKFKIIQDRDYQSDFDKLIIDIKRIEGVN